MSAAQIEARRKKLEALGGTVRKHIVMRAQEERQGSKPLEVQVAKHKKAKLDISESELLRLQASNSGFHGIREYRFDPLRRWRIDLAFPGLMLAVEIDGGAFTEGRHTRGVGFVKDMEKSNALTLAGWRLLRFTPEQVRKGEALEVVLKALAQSGKKE